MIGPIVFRLAHAVLPALALSLSAFAHEPHVTIADPGFRPESEFATAFLDTAEGSTIAVYPTVVRRSSRTAHSFTSQQQVVAFINDHGLATAIAGKKRISLGALQEQVFASQWELFSYDMEQAGTALDGQSPNAQYHLVLEFVLPVTDQEIFGVHCFILNRENQNAFSFLLNSHHQLFVDAELVAKGRSEEARAALLERATQVAMTALYAQVKKARGLVQP